MQQPGNLTGMGVVAGLQVPTVSVGCEAYLIVGKQVFSLKDGIMVFVNAGPLGISHGVWAPQAAIRDAPENSTWWTMSVFRLKVEIDCEV